MKRTPLAIGLLACVVLAWASTHAQQEQKSAVSQHPFTATASDWVEKVNKANADGLAVVPRECIAVGDSVLCTAEKLEEGEE